MSSATERSALFDIEATATTTYVNYDWGKGGTVASMGANDTVYTVSKIIMTNDSGAETINYTLDFPRSSTESIVEAANKDHTLKPGETITHDMRCNTLWIKCLSSTALFRAWGSG